MTPPFKRAVAVWFVLQIVLPFTAPMQACDLVDVLGTRDYRSAPASPESYSTPTTPEELNGQSFVSPIKASALRASTGLVTVAARQASEPFFAIAALSPVQQVQRSILRL